MNAKINRFERILKTRVKVRDDEQILLSFERREEERLMDLIENLGASRSRALDSFGEQGEEFFTAQDLWLRRKAIDFIDDRISREGDTLSGVRKSIESTEARLLEKHREVKIMENYISYMVENRLEEEKRLEQSELDDIAGVRHGSGSGRKRR